MVVWIVIGWDDYYPMADNIKGIYFNEEDAKYKWRELMKGKSLDNYDYYSVEVE